MVIRTSKKIRVSIRDHEKYNEVPHASECVKVNKKDEKNYLIVCGGVILKAMGNFEKKF